MAVLGNMKDALAAIPVAFASISTNANISLSDTELKMKAVSEAMTLLFGGSKQLEGGLNTAALSIKTLGINAQGSAPQIIALANSGKVAGDALINLRNQSQTAAQGFAPFVAGLNQVDISATKAATTFKAGLAPALASGVGPLNSFGSQLGTASTGLNTLGNASDQATSRLGRLREIFSGNRGLVFGFSALFGTLTGIAFEYQLVADASSRVADAQAQVNALVAAGQKGTGAYNQAVSSLAKDQRFLEFSTRNMALAFTNLIPDVLLITNGIIQLTDKFRVHAAAAAEVGTATAGLAAQTVTATGITNTFSVAETTLGTASLTARDAITAEGAVITTFRAEETAAVGTTDALALSQGTLVTRTGEVLPAMAAAGGAMAAVRGEEAFLVASNDALGASFAALGIKAEASGAQVATAGGLIGRIGGLFGRIGGLGGGLVGSVGGPLAIFGGTLAFMTEVLIPAAQATDQKILETGKILDASNKTMGNSIDTLTAKVRSGTATMDEAWTAYAGGVARAAGLITKAQNSIPSPSFLGEKNLLAGTAGKQQPQGPLASLFGGQFTEGTQYNPQGYRVPSLQGPTPTTTPRELPPLTLQEIAANYQAKVARDTAAINRGSRLLNIEGVGQFPLTRQFSKEDVGQINELVPRLQAGRAALGTPGLDDQKRQQIIKEQIDDYNALTKVLGGVGIGVDSLKNKTADNSKVQQQYDDEIKVNTQNLGEYNKFVGAMPEALQKSLGVHQEFAATLDTVKGKVSIADAELAKHVHQVNLEAAGYTSSNAIIGQSIKVKEELVKIGTAVVGGVEEERNHIAALNLFWGQMNETIKAGILTAQQQTIASIDVTKALTNQTEQQFLVNEGMIAGKEAAMQFLQETIVGAAQNKQYQASLIDIATTMGIDLPQGFALTSEQLQNAIVDFRETGSAAIVLSDAIDAHLAPAIQVLGNVLQAKNFKEFKDAFKNLEFGDTPDKLVNAFKNINKEQAGFAEKGREMFTVVSELATTADKLSPKLEKLGAKTLVSDLERIQKLSGSPGAFQPLIDVFKNIAPEDVQKRTFQFINTLDLLREKMQDGKLPIEDVNAVMQQFAKDALASGPPSKELAKDIEKLGGVFDKASGQLTGFLIKGKQLPEVFQKSSANVESIFIPASGKGGTIKAQDPSKVTDEQIAKNLAALKKLQGAEETTPEGKFNTAVDKFASAVATFVGKAAPVTTPTTPTTGVTGTGTGASGVDAGNAAIIKSYQTMVTAVQGLVTTLMKNVIAEFNLMATGPVKVINAMGAAVEKSFSTMYSVVMSITGTFIKTMNTAIVTLNTSIIKTTNTMGVSVEKAYTATYSIVMGITGTFIKAMNNAIVTLNTAIATSTALMNKKVQAEFSSMYTAVTQIATKLAEDVTKASQIMDADVVSAVVDMDKKTQTEFSAMYTATTDIAKKMDTDVVKALEDMATNGVKAADKFASGVTSDFDKVAKSAGTAWQAVTDLGDAVDELDGKKATVTITTHFETTGSPPSGGGGSTSTKVAHDMLGDVISLSAARTINSLGNVVKSFQGGGIDVAHGPQLALFGDNPGGEEVHAFIPMDNPFPTLRNLAKLFKGRGKTSQIIDRALGMAEEIILNAEIHVHQYLDSEKIGTVITKRTFRKMRTR